MDGPASTPAGAYSLQAQVGGHAVASVPVQVAGLNPTLIVSPTTVKPGTTMTIRGSGFAPGEQVVLADMLLSLAGVTTNAGYSSQLRELSIGLVKTASQHIVDDFQNTAVHPRMIAAK